MIMVSTFISFLIAVITVTAEHNSHQLPGRDVVVHMFDWKFSDIASECETWLGPKGYGAVQVSPVNEHVVFEGRPWWERYQPVSYKIQTRSGNEEELLNMTRRCNANGVRVYVEVILNHMAGENPPPVIGTANSTADPVRYRYPAVPYKFAHFNKPCEIVKWNDGDQLRNCEVSGLRDLNHTQEYVRGKLVGFLDKLVDLGVAGFVIDSAKHIWPADLELLLGRVKDLNTDFGFPEKSRAFIINDLVDFGSMAGDIGRYEYHHLGRVTDFLPPGEFGRAFRGFNNLRYLRNWGPQWNFLPSHLSLVFLANIEIQRGLGVGGQDALTYRDTNEFKMASAFLLAHPFGMPRILSSYHFNDVNQGAPMDMFNELLPPEPSMREGCKNGWICEHRWLSISNMIEFRNEAHGTYLNNWWDNKAKQIAFSRGEKSFAVWNGQNRDFDWRLQTCLPPGLYCDIFGGLIYNGKCSGTVVTVNDDGEAHIFISVENENAVLAIHTGPGSALSKSCPRKTLKKLLSMYWTTNCYRNSKVHLKL